MDSDAMATKGSMKNNIHQVITGRKRFYKNVGIKAVVEGKEEKYVVTLDGRNLRTPARNPLQLPTKELALCIAAEWDAQTDQRKGLQPVTMPLMSLASTAIDQIAVDRDITIANCVKYLPTDSALFFTSPEDRILLKKQKLHLQPVIKALNKKLQIDLQTTQAMNGRNQQSENTVVTIHRVVEAMDDFTLACLQSATIECKSIVLGLAFVGRLISLEESIAASRLEEEFQLEIWGVVEGGHDMDRLNNAVALSAAHTFMTLYADSAQAKNILQVKQ
jgi:ATP synthase mitochondrial F1 complex assembly factor 2